MDLPEQQEQAPEADCVEAERPALELHEQQKQTPGGMRRGREAGVGAARATAADAGGGPRRGREAGVGLHEQQEQAPKAGCVEAERPRLGRLPEQRLQ